MAQPQAQSHVTVDYVQLLATSDEFSSRGLIHAAKWLAELSIGLADVSASSENWSRSSAATSSQDVHYRIAKSLFDCSEFMRCSSYLAERDMKDSRSEFLRLYAKYLAGEKSREETSETVLGPKDGPVHNIHIVSILQQLEALQAAGSCDTYLMYFLGVVYRQLEKIEDAKVALMQAINMNEYNWAAWEELSACMSTPANINKTLHHLPDCLLAKIYNVMALLDLHLSSEDVVELLDELEVILKDNLYLKSLRATLYYNAQDFESAETTFDEILARDPHRIDNLDIYSNVLFVLDRRAKLGHLAKVASETDKFRPETCCVVGNYYSLISEHEKAVTFFRKALKLNRSYLAAWTLMGHEYVELKNTHAAIESYRRAVDINKKDYRAWYGLGQAYEMLEMHYYALHYFQRAAALKPYDLRMWTAMGNCYEKLGRYSEAIKSYQRALMGDGSFDLTHMLKIGELYERAGDVEAARRYFQAAVDAGTRDSDLDVSIAQAWLERNQRLV